MVAYPYRCRLVFPAPFTGSGPRRLAAGDRSNQSADRYGVRRQGGVGPDAAAGCR